MRLRYSWLSAVLAASNSKQIIKKMEKRYFKKILQIQSHSEKTSDKNSGKKSSFDIAACLLCWQVGAVSGEWPLRNWARICIPSVPLHISAYYSHISAEICINLYSHIFACLRPYSTHYILSSSRLKPRMKLNE